MVRQRVRMASMEFEGNDLTKERRTHDCSVQRRDQRVVWDDTGIEAWDTFGGLIEMPTLNRIAEQGLRIRTAATPT